MRVLTGGEMEEVERRAVGATGVSLSELMERAGAAVARTAMRIAKQGPIVIVSGKGNNGGDGIVAARLLAEAGAQVRLLLLARPDELSAESSVALARLEEVDTAPEPTFLLSAGDLSKLEESLSEAALVIDCLFGFNLRGAIRGLGADAVRAINAATKPVLSVDVPSGVEADSGRVSGDAVRATRTLTFSAPKVGLVIPPGAELAGTVDVANVGIPSDLIESTGAIELTDAACVASLLPGRRLDVHKKSVGRVLVVAGSVGMTGAACLAAQGALRAGAGTVSVAVPRSLNEIFEQKLTEIMTIPMPETMSRSLLAEAAEPILELCATFDAVVIGPGLSLDDSTVELARSLVARVPLPIVVDADALNALVNGTEILKARTADAVITPHSGELARLLQTTSQEIQANRLAYAKRSAREWGVVTVLKGAATVVSDGRTLTVNPTGNPGLATAGTGDVLAGMIGSLIAQGVTPSDAAIAGAYLHGLAGDLAARKLTERCVIATDVISFLPKAFGRVERVRGRGSDTSES